jgi:hypothetical protein
VELGTKVTVIEVVEIKKVKVGDVLVNPFSSDAHEHGIEIAATRRNGAWVTLLDAEGVQVARTTAKKAVKLVRTGVIESSYEGSYGPVVGVEVETGTIGGWMPYRKVLVVPEGGVKVVAEVAS